MKIGKLDKLHGLDFTIVRYFKLISTYQTERLLNIPNLLQEAVIVTNNQPAQFGRRHFVVWDGMLI